MILTIEETVFLKMLHKFASIIMLFVMAALIAP